MKFKDPFILQIIFSITVLFLYGCSREYWDAKINLMKAEEALAEAVRLKDQKVDFEARKPYYQKACDFFFKVYEISPDPFSLNTIESATDSCWRAGDSNKEEEFQLFQDEYMKKHPKEAEFGDPGDLVAV